MLNHLSTKSSLAFHQLNYVGSVGDDVPHSKITSTPQPGLPDIAHLHLHIWTLHGQHTIIIHSQLPIHDDYFLLTTIECDNLRFSYRTGTCSQQLTGFSPLFKSSFFPKSAAYNNKVTITHTNFELPKLSRQQFLT